MEGKFLNAEGIKGSNVKVKVTSQGLMYRVALKWTPWHQPNMELNVQAVALTHIYLLFHGNPTHEMFTL
jgi:hypothetical protein